MVKYILNQSLGDKAKISILEFWEKGLLGMLKGFNGLFSKLRDKTDDGQKLKDYWGHLPNKKYVNSLVIVEGQEIA